MLQTGYLTDVQVLFEKLWMSKINPPQKYLKIKIKLETEIPTKTLKNQFEFYVNLVVESYMETR